MCFDALTIGGLLLAFVSGGLVVGVVIYNERPSRPDSADSADQAAAAGDL